MTDGQHESKSTPAVVLSNTAYDKLKFFTQVVLPGLGTLYAAIAVFWGLPKVNEVVGTIIAVDTFLGLLLTWWSKTYQNSDVQYDGVVVREESPDGETPLYSLQVDPTRPMMKVLEEQDKLVFKIPKDL